MCCSTDRNRSSRCVSLRTHVSVGLVLLATAVSCGCAAVNYADGRPRISGDLRSRVEHGVGPAKCDDDSLVPPGVTLEDGVTADEAVAMSLWNNSDFHATLARIGMARGDLIQSDMLTNPQFMILLPGGTKQLEYALFMPVESLLLRKHRVSIAQKDYCRIAEELVQNGLNLVRDVRQAHADLALAQQRVELADQAVTLRTRIVDLTGKRLQAGEISELEATSARLDQLRTQATAVGLPQQVEAARARLAMLMGIAVLQLPLVATGDAEPPDPLPEISELVAEAMQSRPDLKAARMAFAAEQERAALSRWRWLRVDAVADGNSGGVGPANFGPGVRLDLPIFDRNEGGNVRADWSVYQASQNYYALRDRVIMEVRVAAAQSQQADASLTLLQTEVMSSLLEAAALAEKAYRDGGADYFLVLQTSSQLLEIRASELQLLNDRRKAQAELERSVGRRLFRGSTTTGQAEPEAGGSDVVGSARDAGTRSSAGGRRWVPPRDCDSPSIVAHCE